MKNKIIIIFYFILTTLFFPVVAFGGFFSLLWIFMALINSSPAAEMLKACSGVTISLIYITTYIYAFKKIRLEKEFSATTYFPLASLLLAIFFVLLVKPTWDDISIVPDCYGLPIRNYEIVESEDTHGGFLGDGYYYAIIDCSKDRETAYETLKRWKKMPLSENLNLMIYGGEKGGSTYSAWISETVKIPKIENGYYLFEDRHTESKNSSNDSELFNRHSYNFSITIYDADTDIMYYFEYDT